MDPTCSCQACKQYTRAYLHNVVTRNIASAAVLVSYHNIAYTQALTRRMRQALKVGTVWECSLRTWTPTATPSDTS